MSSWLIAACAVTLLGVDAAAHAKPLPRVKVLPVFFVPSDEAPPTDAQCTNLMRHLEWARTRYRELLKTDTFEIAGKKPLVYRAKHDLAYYKAQPEGAAPQIVSELLADLKCTRTTCPYVLLTVEMNPHDDWPGGGGRPINGGNNEGGGIVILSSHGMDTAPNVQSTVQHELGHSFGLPHVEDYGYDMTTNDSLMSYNPHHHTNYFEPSKTPGKFIPEDIRALALNHRVFAKLKFDPKKDVPPGYKMADIVTLGPMNLP